MQLRFPGPVDYSAFLHQTRTASNLSELGHAGLWLGLFGLLPVRIGQDPKPFTGLRPQRYSSDEQYSGIYPCADSDINLRNIAA